MYEALIMLHEAINPTIEQYAHEVKSFYKSKSGEKPRIELENESFRIFFKGIEFSIDKNCHSDVAIESKELAGFAKPESKKEISMSKCRFELNSTDDLNMVYFNDFLFLVQAAEKFGKVWVFNPTDGEFM